MMIFAMTGLLWVFEVDTLFDLGLWYRLLFFWSPTGYRTIVQALPIGMIVERRLVFTFLSTYFNLITNFSTVRSQMHNLSYTTQMWMSDQEEGPYKAHLLESFSKSLKNSCFGGEFQECVSGVGIAILWNEEEAFDLSKRCLSKNELLVKLWRATF